MEGGERGGRPGPPMPRGPHPRYTCSVRIRLVQLLYNSNRQFPFPRSRAVHRECKSRRVCLSSFRACFRSSAPTGDGRPQARRSAQGSMGSLTKSDHPCAEAELLVCWCTQARSTQAASRQTSHIHLQSIHVSLIPNSRTVSLLDRSCLVFFNLPRSVFIITNLFYL